MVTRQELSEAALRRYEATRAADESEELMRSKYREFAALRDLHLAAVRARDAATRELAEIERRLLEQDKQAGSEK
jgi:hypothetical protein